MSEQFPLPHFHGLSADEEPSEPHATEAASSQSFGCQAGQLIAWFKYEIALSSRRFDAIDKQLALIVSSLSSLTQLEKIAMSTFADLTAAVEAEKTVDGSIETLLTGVVQQLNDLKSKTNLSPADQATLDKEVADLTAEKAALVAAVLANTPVSAPATRKKP